MTNEPWGASAIVATQATRNEWEERIPNVKITDWNMEDGEVWPHGLIGNGPEVMELMTMCRHTPDWCLVRRDEHEDGKEVLEARFLMKWATSPE